MALSVVINGAEMYFLPYLPRKLILLIQLNYDLFSDLSKLNYFVIYLLRGPSLYLCYLHVHSIKMTQ